MASYRPLTLEKPQKGQLVQKGNHIKMNGPDELYTMDCNGTQHVLQQSTMGEGK